jgi:hypothetical protein
MHQDRVGGAAECGLGDSDHRQCELGGRPSAAAAGADHLVEDAVNPPPPPGGHPDGCSGQR